MLFFLFWTIAIATAFKVGTLKENTVLPFPIEVDGVVQDTALALDANWRWIQKGGQNCQTLEVDCELEGVTPEDWVAPYGVSTRGAMAQLNYVTEGPYSTNIGSRVYVTNGASYEGFNMIGKEIEFTVDVSQIPCGLNGAMYFVEMPLNNPYNNALDATYGVNYGDAQCPKDIKYVEGTPNDGKRGACSNEVDLWEANAYAATMAFHPCKIKGVSACTDDQECGVGSNRFKGVCDKNGADYNARRHGVNEFGPGLTIDTRKPVTVVIQFHADQGEITSVTRLMKQGSTVVKAELTPDSIRADKQRFGEPNHFEELGGFTTLSKAFERKMVLVLSLWDSQSMAWLDSTYPKGSTKPSDIRGPCNHERPDERRRSVPSSYVRYSDIKIRSLHTQPKEKESKPDCIQILESLLNPPQPKKYTCERCVLDE